MKHSKVAASTETGHFLIRCIVLCLFAGFGVFVKQEHFKGDFLLEYVGERLSEEEGERRERKYPENKMYYYTHNGKKLWYGRDLESPAFTD